MDHVYCRIFEVEVVHNDEEIQRKKKKKSFRLSAQQFNYEKLKWLDCQLHNGIN